MNPKDEYIRDVIKVFAALQLSRKIPHQFDLEALVQQGESLLLEDSDSFEMPECAKEIMPGVFGMTLADLAQEWTQPARVDAPTHKIRVNGETFTCECGNDYFSRPYPEKDMDLFECIKCDQQYKGT